MVNTTEDNPGHHITILDYPQVSFCQNLGDLSDFTIFWRRACPLRFFFFCSLCFLLKRNELAIMTMTMMMTMMMVTFQEYGYYITLLCCFPKVSPSIESLSFLNLPLPRNQTITMGQNHRGWFDSEVLLSACLM